MSHLTHKLNNLAPGEVVASFEGNIIGGAVVNALADADDLAKICVNCKFDILLTSGKKLELKSYGVTTINSIKTNSKFRNQLKAYFQDNGGLFDYVFNGKKPISQTLIDDGFKELYKYDTYKFYDDVALDPTTKKWFTDHNIMDVDDFINAVDKLPPFGNVLYDMLKIQN